MINSFYKKENERKFPSFFVLYDISFFWKKKIFPAIPSVASN